jgi:glycosyltransferase involved in cell wall biosynthesis
VDSVKKKATHFIAGTDTSKFMLELEGIKEDRISVIPLPVDTERFKPSKKNYNLVKKYNIDEKNLIILFVGRVLDAQKGISDLIYAFYKIAKENNNAVLLIAGNGPDIEGMNSLVRKLGLTKKVFFIGFIPDDHLVDLYNLCDVFCGPSRITKIWQEQFGYTMNEAMSCGKPVVSTLSGGKTGLLAGVKNPHSLYQALLKLIDNKDLREELGKNARKSVVDNLDLNLVVRKLAKFYKALR